MPQALLNKELSVKPQSQSKIDPQRKHRKAVITGIGIVSPLGIGVEAFWNGLLEGKSAVDKITRFNTRSFPSRIAAEVKDFDPWQYMAKRRLKYFSRASQFAVAASNLAIEDAGLSGIDPFRTDIIIGSAISSLGTIEETLYRSKTKLEEYDEHAINPADMFKVFISAPASAVALEIGSKGYVTTVATACASAINAVGVATDRIEEGHADVAIAGGLDTPITRIVLNALCAADFLSTENTNPKDCLCPFDKRRSHSVLGEGCVLFVLEDYNHAVARAATGYAEIVDYHQENENTNELYISDEEGQNWANMLMTLIEKNERKVPDHINAHAPSDTAIDYLETLAFKKALGNRAYKPPVLSIKGLVGSAFSAAGAQQIATACLSLKHGMIPPNYNYKEPDPLCDLKYPVQPKKGKLDRVLVNSHGLGGVNSAMLLKGYKIQ